MEAVYRLLLIVGICKAAVGALVAAVGTLIVAISFLADMLK